MKYIFPLLLLLAIGSGCSKVPDVEPNEVDIVMPYPTPAGSIIHIHVRNVNQSAYHIEVFDPEANSFFEESVPAGAARNSIALDLSSKSAGKYVVVLKMNSVTYTNKFFKI